MPVSRYSSTASSTQADPRPWPVWPSASSEIRRDPVKIFARLTDHAYGVAGSRMVPMTMIGVVLIWVNVSGARWVDGCGKNWQCTPENAMYGPKTGALVANSLASALY